MTAATLDIETLPVLDRYENYYWNRAFPKIEKDMGDCEGFESWLAEHDPALNNRIEQADKDLNVLWQNQSDFESFKDACKAWYRLLMEAKKGFDAWKAKKREEALHAGRQEKMALR